MAGHDRVIKTTEDDAEFRRLRLALSMRVIRMIFDTEVITASEDKPAVRAPARPPRIVAWVGLPNSAPGAKDRTACEEAQAVGPVPQMAGIGGPENSNPPQSLVC